MPENIIAPWEYSSVFFWAQLATDLFFIALVWLWARSGRSKREKKVPFDRTAENYAGTVQAAYGQIPSFLIVIYIVTLVFAIGYTILSISTGVKY